MPAIRQMVSSWPGGTCSSSQEHEVPHWEVAGPWDGGDVGGLDVAMGGNVRSGAWVGGRVGGLEGGDVGGLVVAIGGKVRPGV